MRKKVIFGNWKMNHTRNEALNFVLEMNEEIKNAKNHGILIGIAPTYMSLDIVAKKKTKSLLLAAQNVNEHESGAYTGEVSIAMLKEIKNLTHVIIGHSERRQYYNETSVKCNEKMMAMEKANLIPIYCVGETLQQFENDETKEIIKEQIHQGLLNLSSDFVTKMIIAYEPVWSIGTGLIPTNEDLTEILKIVKELLPKNKLLYGGSVTEENITMLKNCPLIDGYLLGGLSLKVSNLKDFLTKLTY